LKIADFGLSRCIDSTGSTSAYGSNVGTRSWIAPEVLKSTNDHSKSSDVFACGLVLHYILSVKRHPFAPDDRANKSVSQITETENNIMGGIMEGWDNSLCPEAAEIIKKMLSSDDRRRPGADEALSHPLFWSKKKKIDLLIAVGNQPEFECPRAKRPIVLTAVETDLETSFSTTFKKVTWNHPRYVHMPDIYAEMKKKRKYETKSVVELVRFIRNAIAYVSINKRPTPIRKQLLEDFVLLEYFPNLVMEVLKAVTTHGWDQTRDEIKYALN
jgi:serine/threonine protein kinase